MSISVTLLKQATVNKRNKPYRYITIILWDITLSCFIHISDEVIKPTISIYDHNKMVYQPNKSQKIVSSCQQLNRTTCNKTFYMFQCPVSVISNLVCCHFFGYGLEDRGSIRLKFQSKSVFIYHHSIINVKCVDRIAGTI